MENMESFKDSIYNNVWLKVIIGMIITLCVVGFSSLEKRKLDKSVFDLQKENTETQFTDIKKNLKSIENKIDVLVKRSFTSQYNKSK